MLSKKEFWNTLTPDLLICTLLTTSLAFISSMIDAVSAILLITYRSTELHPLKIFGLTYLINIALSTLVYMYYRKYFPLQNTSQSGGIRAKYDFFTALFFTSVVILSVVILVFLSAFSFVIK